MASLFGNMGNGADLKNWWRDLPIHTTFIFITTLVSSVLWVIIPLSIVKLMLLPNLLLYFFCIWEPFTFPYVTAGLISGLFSLCAYMPISSKKERLSGTFRYICSFTIQNLVISAIFLIIYLALESAGILPLPFIRTFLFGLWPAIMHDMVLRSNIDGEEQVPFMCFPVIIKRKWYPWAFFLLFSLLGVSLSLLTGILSGYLEYYGFFKCTEISDATAERWEKRFCCFLERTKGFISVSDSGSELPGLRPVRFGEAQQDSGNFRQNPSPSPSVPFSGPGYRLGSDEEGSSGFDTYFKSRVPGK